jgi:hypothetical protein
VGERDVNLSDGDLLGSPRNEDLGEEACRADVHIFSECRAKERPRFVIEKKRKA